MAVSVTVSNLRIRGDGLLEFAFPVEDGAAFSVETSRDLKVWEPVELDFVSDGEFLRATLAPDGRSQFFRRKP